MTNEQNEQLPEIVEIDGKSVKLDERLLKVFEHAVERGLINIEKKDFRATVVHREEPAQPPDAFTTFIDIDENKIDEIGFPRELDVKGTQSLFDIYQSNMVELGTVFSKLIDWQYIPTYDKKHGWQLEEVDLAKVSLISKKWNNLGLFGQQSNKHLRGLRAASGLPDEESRIRKGLKWMGFVRHDKEEYMEQFGGGQ